MSDSKEVEEVVLPEDIAQDEVQAKRKGNRFAMVDDVKNGIRDFLHNVEHKHHQGMLPIQLFAVVIVYNFIFFQSEEGKEIYTLLPILAAGICYLLKYWEFPPKPRYYLSGGALFFGLSWDLILSISFIPTYSNWGYHLDSIPTLILDILALTSALVWFTNEKKYPRNVIILLDDDNLSEQ